MDDYEFDLEEDFPIEFIDGNLGDNTAIEFRLGFKMDAEQVVVMAVQVVEGGGFLPGYDGIFDLRFGFRTKCMKHDWKVSGLDFAQVSAREFIPNDMRPKVLAMVIRAAQELIRHVRPEVITMATYDVELPPHALVKYRSIERCLHEAGYDTVDTYRDGDGRDRWHLQKRS